jgi:iron complex outermembrane receptor protein
MKKAALSRQYLSRGLSAAISGLLLSSAFPPAGAAESKPIVPTTAEVSKPAGETSAKGEAVEMSPFVVSSNSDVGYLAGNTLAGSRMNTSLKDTAASISVMTEEFLKDIAATNVTDALEWGNNTQLERADTFANFTGSTSPNDNSTFASFDTFRVRGQPATVTRNYFAWTLPMDTYNIDRVEEARGPNSILFGIGSAGGIISSSTKQAVTNRSFRRASGSTGSYGTYRGSFDINQAALGGNLGFRVNAVYDHSETDRLYAFSNNRRVHLAVKYNLTEKTRLRAEYETGAINQDIAALNAVYDGMIRWSSQGRPTFASPVAANAALGINRYATTARITYVGNNDLLINMANQNFGSNTNDILTEAKTADRSINTGGPGQRRDAYFNTTSVFFEQQLAKGTFLELAYNHQESEVKSYMASSSTRVLAAEPNQFFPNGARNPWAGGLFLDGPWTRYLQNPRTDNTRLSVSTELDAGKWGKYRLAGLGEYEAKVGNRGGSQIEVWSGLPFNSQPENAANQVYRRNYVTEGDWSTYYANGPAQLGLIRDRRDPLTGRTLSSTWVANGSGQQSDPTYQGTFLLGGQARYLRDRFIVGFGLRRDALKVVDRGAVRNPATQEFAVDYVNSSVYNYVARTRTIGAVAHLTKRFSAYYNYSENTAVPNTGVRILPDSKLGPPPQGVGQDAGVSFDLGSMFYSRLTFYQSGQSPGVDGRFSATQTNPSLVANTILDTLLAQGLISSAAADARRSNSSGGTYERKTRGVELSVTSNLTKNWRLQANYSYSDGYEEHVVPEIFDWAARELPFYHSVNQNLVTSLGTTIAQVLERFERQLNDAKAFEGQALPGNRQHKVNAFTRYTFSSGPLKGAFIGGGYRHQSKIQIGRVGLSGDSASFLTPEGVASVTARTGQIVYGNSYWMADALAGYRFQRVPFFKRLTLQLNISNLFNYDKPLVTQIYADGRPAVGYGDNRPAINRWALLPPRTWRLSVDLEF